MKQGFEDKELDKSMIDSGQTGLECDQTGSDLGKMTMMG